jgi:hypothetical protein
VDRPFEIDGETTGYFRAFWPSSGDNLTLHAHRCIGWDLRVSDSSSTSTLHQEIIVPVTKEISTSNGTRPAGERIWWLNASNDPETGVLPMRDDVGSACFYNYFDETLQTTVHSGNPMQRRNGDLNEGREAYSVGLADGLVHDWLDNALFDAMDEEIVVAGSAEVCASGRDRMELFGLLPDGRMGWWTWSGAWTSRGSLAAPDGTTLTSYRPGAHCMKGTIELFATGTDGTVWWQHMDSTEQWNDSWEHVDDATTPVSAGIEVVGTSVDHFHLFALGNTGELRYAEYDGEWTGRWDNLGASGVGTPAARIGQEGRMDVFIHGTDDYIYQLWMSDATWRGWLFNWGPITSDPAVTSWHYDRLDLLLRPTRGTLDHLRWEVNWTAVESSIAIPEGAPVAVARHRGRLDLFVTQTDGRIWHGFWPRLPRAQ